MPGPSVIALGSQVQNEALKYWEQLQKIPWTQNSSHPLPLLLFPEVATGPAVKDEARGHLGPAFLHWLNTPPLGGPSALVRDAFCLKGIWLEVCLSLETEQTQEAQELRDCRTVSQRPKQTQFTGNKASQANRASVSAECRAASTWTDRSPLPWVGRGLQLPRQFTPCPRVCPLTREAFMGPDSARSAVRSWA